MEVLKLSSAFSYYRVIAALLFRCFICFVLLAVQSYVAAEQKTVSVATLADYAPYCYLISDADPDGVFAPGEDSPSFRGESWDVVRNALHFTGYSIDLKVLPWKRAYVSVEHNQNDMIFPIGRSAMREELFYFSSEPVNSVDFLIYLRPDSEIQWQGIENFSGYSVAQIRGFNYGDVWDMNTGVVKVNVDSIDQGFRMLASGRVDGFIGYEKVWDHYLQQADKQRDFRKLPVFDRTYEYIAVSRDNPRGKALLDTMDTEIARLRAAEYQ